MFWTFRATFSEPDHHHAGRRRAWILTPLLLALAGFALTGCAAASPTSYLAAPVTTPTTTPTTTIGPVLAAPTQVFGGDCSQALTAAEVGDALGTIMKTANDDFERALPDEFAVSQNGGISCAWVPNNMNTGVQAYTIVLPATFLPTDESSVPYCYGTDSGTTGTSSCSFSVSTSGLWLSGVVYTRKGTTNADARIAIAKLEAQFTVHATAAPTFGATPPAAGSWTGKTNADCEALATSAPVAVAMIGTDTTAESGNSTGEMPNGYYAALGASHEGCLWKSGSTYTFETDTLAGGAWVQTQLAAVPGATEIHIDGVDRALVGKTGLDIFEGPNWLHIGSAPKDPGPLAAALVAALNPAR
jgi:hypothetical protein